MNPKTRITVLLALALCSAASAAPPADPRLFPAGAQRGTTVPVTATGTFASWPVRVGSSDEGITAAAGKRKGELTVTVAAGVAPGVHWLRAHDKEGGGNLRPFFVGTLPEAAEKEPNDEPRKPQALAGPSVTVNGRLEKAGDVDCFAVEA